MLAASYAGLSITTVGFLFFDAGDSVWWVRAIMFVRGLFLAFSFIPLQAASYARISPADTGRASAIYSTQRQVAAATGVALLSTVLLSTIPTDFGPGVVPPELRAGFASAFHWAIGVAVALTALAGVVALRIRDADAAVTMQRGPGRSPGPAADAH